MLVAVNQYLQMAIDDKFYQQLQLRRYLLRCQLQILDQYFPDMAFHFMDKTRIAVLTKEHCQNTGIALKKSL